MNTTFENIERVEGTAGDDIFLAGPGVVPTADAESIWFQNIGEVRPFFFTGNAGADTFTDSSGEPGGVSMVDYNPEKYAHGDFGVNWGDDLDGNGEVAVEDGVVVNLSAAEVVPFGGAPILGGTARDTFGDIDEIEGVLAFQLTDTDDAFYGNNLGNSVFAREGNDDLTGGAGDDNFDGGAGHDNLIGNGGDDGLQGGSGDDSIDGGNGSDYIEAGAGTDHIVGGNDEGFDLLNYANAASGGIEVNASGDGAGTVVEANELVDTYSGIEQLRGSMYADVFNGSAGREKFAGNAGNDLIDGAGGDRDAVDYRVEQFDNETPEGVVVNLSGAGFNYDGIAGDDIAANTGIDTFGDTDTLLNIEEVRGTTFGDVIVGSGADNSFESLAGNDLLFGGGGDDYFNAGKGVDTIHGGEGFDAIEYYFDDDGADVGFVGINVTLTGIGSGTLVDAWGFTDTFTGIEEFRGTGYSDVMTGHDGDDHFYGGDGADALSGGAGEDFFADVSADGFAETLSGGADGTRISSIGMKAPLPTW